MGAIVRTTFLQHDLQMSAMWSFYDCPSHLQCWGEQTDRYRPDTYSPLPYGFALTLPGRDNQ